MKIGLLPFYLALYDEVVPDLRPMMQNNVHMVAAELEKQGCEVVPAPICRVGSEFAEAYTLFEKSGVEAVATLHLAYSPSLESAEIVAASELPVVVVDTTADYEFGFGDSDKIMPNHGIHGVQDFCNLLVRYGKPFLIAAGHRKEPGYFARVKKLLSAAAMSHKMRHLRVGTLGGEFAGMGDFRIPDGALGIRKILFSEPDAPTSAEIAAEKERCRNEFDTSQVKEEALERTVRASLRLRRWADQEKLDAFTICFPGITRSTGWETVPFLEASRAMNRRIGYAGEGDVLTAGFCAAVLSQYPDSTFSEMFCPDWKGNRLFTSHMGEVNPRVLAHRPWLFEMPYRFSETGAPVIATGCCKEGDAILADLAPIGGGRFRLIAAPVTFTAPEQSPHGKICGWFTPASGKIAPFLENYSLAGGTHHFVISYGADPDVFAGFSDMMKWDFCLLSGVFLKR